MRPKERTGVEWRPHRSMTSIQCCHFQWISRPTQRWHWKASTRLVSDIGVCFAYCRPNTTSECLPPIDHIWRDRTAIGLRVRRPIHALGLTNAIIIWTNLYQWMKSWVRSEKFLISVNWIRGSLNKRPIGSLIRQFLCRADDTTTCAHPLLPLLCTLLANDSFALTFIRFDY